MDGFMEHIFWLEKDRVAGRSGPNKHPWSPAALDTFGIRSILSVNHGDECDVDSIDQVGLKYACIPMSRNAPPEPGDLEICLEALPRALTFIRQSPAPVMIHCRSGKDRTGLVMAYYLMETHGLGVEEAMTRVREVRPIAFSAEGWWLFCQEVLHAAHHLKNNQ